MHKEVPVPGGFQPFVSEAGFGLVLLQEVEGELGEDGEVLSGHPAPFALLVLAESHVERPVELVLDLPELVEGRSIGLICELILLTYLPA